MTKAQSKSHGLSKLFKHYYYLRKKNKRKKNSLKKQSEKRNNENRNCVRMNF